MLAISFIRSLISFMRFICSALGIILLTSRHSLPIAESAFLLLAPSV
ncbi:hypothetical protein BQ1740_3671 [Bacillus subtilis]|nr:hypothetical protein BQ1740_3671 [Bacillus subtilis]